MNKSNIEWCDYTWNSVTGCTKISEGCAHCYAETMATTRLAGRCGYPADDPFKITLHHGKLNEPLHTRKPGLVFVCSMGDLFHDDVPENFICSVLTTTMAAPWHTFVLLTKRPKRMLEVLRNSTEAMMNVPTWYQENLWLGVTAENQQRADERIPILLQIPAAVRFVSVEPMLGPVDLRGLHIGGDDYADALDGTVWCAGRGPSTASFNSGLDWVICGAETGPGKRPMDLDWARSLRDQCADACVPFFFKKDSNGNGNIDGVVHHAFPRDEKAV